MGRPDRAVRRGVSTCPTVRTAVREMHDAIARSDGAHTRLFFSLRLPRLPDPAGEAAAARIGVSAARGEARARLARSVIRVG